jgi:hypothetical protein
VGWLTGRRSVKTNFPHLKPVRSCSVNCLTVRQQHETCLQAKQQAAAAVTTAAYRQQRRRRNNNKRPNNLPMCNNVINNNKIFALLPRCNRYCMVAGIYRRSKNPR